MVWDRLPFYSYLKRHTGIRRLLIRANERFHRKTRSRSDLDELTEVHLASAQVETRVVRPPDSSSAPVGNSIPDVARQAFQRFAEAERQPSTLTTIKSGRALGVHGAPVTHDGHLVIDLAWGPHQIASFAPTDLVAAATAGMRNAPTYLAGRAALLTTNWGRGYFHWLIDVLPRMDALLENDIEASRLDHVIVPSLMAPFQQESLQELGFQRQQIVSSLRHRHIVAEELLVPSLVRPTGPFPKWAAEFLRRAITPVEPASHPRTERLFITRKSTDHGVSQFNGSIQSWANHRGFAPIAFENYSLPEVVWILQRCRVLLGESGAGLANIVFAPVGATLIEISHLTTPDPVFWDLAGRCGHSYRLVSESEFVSGDGATRELEAFLDSIAI